MTNLLKQPKTNNNTLPPNIPKIQNIKMTLNNVSQHIHNTVETNNNIVKFTKSTLHNLKNIRNYISKIFHQTDVLILSNKLII